MNIDPVNRDKNVDAGFKDLMFYLLGIVVGGLAYWLNYQKEELKAAKKATDDEIQQVKRDFNSLSLKVVGEYATRAEVDKIHADISGQITKLGDAVFKKLDRIEEKVDQKADKSSSNSGAV